MSSRPGKRERLKSKLTFLSTKPGVPKAPNTELISNGSKSANIRSNDQLQKSTSTSAVEASKQAIHTNDERANNFPSVLHDNDATNAVTSHQTLVGVPNIDVDQTPSPVKSVGSTIDISAFVDGSCPCWNKALKLLGQDEFDTFKAMTAITPTQLDWNKLIASIEAKFGDSEQGKDRRASSQWFSRLKRISPSIAAVKGASMMAARADPHQIAPYVCAGIFCVIELMFNSMAAEDALLVTEIVSEGSIILKKWTTYEAQISASDNPVTRSETNQMNQELPQLYKQTLSLLLSILSHLDASKWQRAKSTLSQIAVQWKYKFEHLKLANKKCDDIKSRIDVQLKAQKDYEAILDWICSASSGQSHYQVMEKTGVDKGYSERCLWLLESREFNAWRNGFETDISKRVLWLNGSVGTGKTTLMCRVVESLTYDHSVEVDKPMRLCHYYCSSDKGVIASDCETIIRKLLRQMAVLPDSTLTNEVISRFNQHKQISSHQISLSLGQWQELFMDVARSSRQNCPNILLIDALDECIESERNKLLEFLAGVIKNCPTLYVMLASQLHVKVSTYFEPSRLELISVMAENTKADMEFYINNELLTRAASPTNKEDSVWSNDSCATLRERFRKALLKGSNGMFQWVKVWLAIIFPDEPITHTKEAELLLSTLENQSRIDPSVEHQWALLDSAYLKLYTTVRHRPADRVFKVRAYRIILSSFMPLTMATVAEATSVEDDGTVTETVTEKYIRGLCHNFFVEDSSGMVILAHESAKLFLQGMMNHDSKDSLLDDFLPATGNAELFRICMQVMQQPGHPIWQRWNIAPQEWVTSYGNETELRRWSRVVGNHIGERATTPKDRPSLSINMLLNGVEFEEVSEWLQVKTVCANHFANYIISCWLMHWEDLITSIEEGHRALDQAFTKTLVSVLEAFSGSTLAGCILLLHAYHQCIGKYFWADLGIVSSYTPLLWLYMTAFRTAGCVARQTNNALTADRMLLISVFGLIPRKYLFEYVDWVEANESKSIICLSESSNLTKLLDNMMMNLTASNLQGASPLHIVAAMDTGADMVKVLLRVERAQCQKRGLKSQINDGCLMLSRNCDGETPLHRAARFGTAQSVKTILSFEANSTACRVSDESLEPRNPPGWVSCLACKVNKRLETPLHNAAFAGNEEAVALLIKAGAAEANAEGFDGEDGLVPVLHSRDSEGLTTLAHALRSDRPSVQVLEMMLKFENFEINQEDKEGLAPLAYAMQNPKTSVGILQTLLKSPSLLMNRPDRNGETPMHHLVSSRMNEKFKAQLLSLLLADPRSKADVTDRYGQTPLWVAAAYGLPSVVKMLCDRPDVDPDRQTVSVEVHCGLQSISKILRSLKSYSQHIESILNQPVFKMIQLPSMPLPNLEDDEITFISVSVHGQLETHIICVSKLVSRSQILEKDCPQRAKGSSSIKSLWQSPVTES